MLAVADVPLSLAAALNGVPELAAGEIRRSHTQHVRHGSGAAEADEPAPARPVAGVMVGKSGDLSSRGAAADAPRVAGGADSGSVGTSPPLPFTSPPPSPPSWSDTMALIW